MHIISMQSCIYSETTQLNLVATSTITTQLK